MAIFTQAMRQFAAAQSSASYGGSFAGASQALRAMQSDAQLAVFGLQALNSAFAAASKNAKITGASVASIRGLSDFAIASGDMEKGLIAAANLVTLLQSGKAARSSQVLSVAQELGPEFEKAFKQATASGRRTNKDLLAMFASGELSQAAGISGTAQNVRGTLMGQLKTFGTEFQVLFADIGQSFIGPTQRTFAELTRIFRRTIVQISGQLNLFANGPFQNVIVDGFDKLGTFTARIVNEYLPRTEELLNKIGSWWTRTSSSVKNTFGSLERFLKRFSEASAEINKFFGGIFRVIGAEFKTGFEGFGQLVIENRDEFQQFGVAIQDLIKTLFEFSRTVREAFFNALPAITQVVNALSSLVTLLSMLVAGISGLGAAGGLLGFAGLGLGAKAIGARNKPGGVGGFFAKNKNFLALSAMAVPSLVPGLGMVGDLATAGLIGGFGGKMAFGGAMNAGNKFLNTRLGMTRLGLPVAALGGTSAAQFGAAGAVGAMGAVGTNAAINFTESQFSNTGINIGTGIAGGAATGAVIGSIIPIIGTTVGAVIGGIIGGIAGWVKSGEAKKRAREAGQRFAGGYADEVTKLIQTGNIREAEKAIADFGTTLEDVSQKVGRSSEFRAKGEEEFEKRLNVIRPAVDMFNRNLRDLTEVTGLAEDQIIQTAIAAEVDLSSNLLDLQQILSETGLAVGRFGEDFNAAIAMSLGESVAAIQDKFKELQAPQVLDEVAQAFREIADAGAVTNEDRQRLLSTVYEQAALLHGNDPLAAAEFIQRNIGTAAAPGVQFTTPNGVLYGTQQDFFGGAGAAMVTAGQAPTKSALQTLITENIVSAIAAQGATVQKASIESVLRDMSLDQLINLGRSAREEDFLSGAIRRTPKGGFYGGGAETMIADLLGVNREQIKVQQADSDKISQAITGLGIQLDPLTTAISKFNDNIDALIAAVKGTGDTYSPRRNLVSTLSKHNRLDMSISGKRTVTSSLRNNGLGSLSSDHAFGMAYDLTGQNLGAYQSAVRAGGGFAEFHGAGGSRHLHVVPGNAPMGDTASPVGVIAKPSGASYSSADSYTINVYPTEGMSPQEVADVVMERIRREQRSARERN